MVHQKYVKISSKKENKWYDRAPPVKARNYLDEMAPINGIIQDNEETRRQREAFRDEVSKRMGELLLRGQTMLDVYCEKCSGILMEDRSGVRRCVTCEVFEENAKEGAQITAKVPLEPEDFDDAPKTIEAPSNSTTVSSVPRDYSTYVDYEDNEEKVQKIPEKVKKTVIFSHNKKNVKTSSEVELAKNAIKQKIKWAAQKLEEEKETRRILEYLEVLKLSAETLETISKI